MKATIEIFYLPNGIGKWKKADFLKRYRQYDNIADIWKKISGEKEKVERDN